VVLDRVDVLTDLVDYGETVVDEAVEDKVEQIARAAAHGLPPGLLAGLTCSEQGDQGPEVALVQGDQIVFPHENGDLAGRRYPGLSIVHGEMEHHEEVGLVLVDLGQLDPAQAVVEIEAVEWVVVGQILSLGLSRPLDIDPSELFPDDGLDAGLGCTIG
jgi:hypothetical protein